MNSSVQGKVATIAVIGGGPRGFSVVEQLILGAEHEIRIDVFDTYLIGAGRIWRPDQSEHLLLNTRARDATIFSGPLDDGPVRAGAGPTLEQWLPPDDSVYDGYWPRGKYGEYLHFAFESMIANAPTHVAIETLSHHVATISRAPDGGYLVRTSTGLQRTYDVVVLATGHPRSRHSQELTTAATPGARRVLDGDSAADLPLSDVAPGETIATLGMGLTFHDVVALLTQGRGGVFRPNREGAITYETSGDEPVIIGVSRSGLPIPVRARDQKPVDFAFRPRLCTDQRIGELRRFGPVDFRTELEPWILAEAAVTYCHTEITNSEGAAQAAEFLDALAQIDDTDPENSVYRIAQPYAVTSRFPSLTSLARPFGTRRFTSHGHWMETLTEHLNGDLERAKAGNVTHPLNAAVDTLRDLRFSICDVVDNGGLTPQSHQQNFLDQFAPCYSLLVSGPPLRRVEELLALIRAGVLTIAAPQAHVVESGRSMVVHTPAVPGALTVDRVVNARISQFDVGRCGSTLYRQLLADGLVRRFRHRGLTGSVETGACEVDPDTAAAIGADGTASPGLFILGIPTEPQRWFTQIGGHRPGFVGAFARDAQRVARSALATVSGMAPLSRRIRPVSVSKA